MIGFKQSVVLAMEGTSTPDDLQVQFWSGSGDKLLKSSDVLVDVQLSSESTAIQGTITLLRRTYVRACIRHTIFPSSTKCM